MARPGSGGSRSSGGGGGGHRRSTSGSGHRVSSSPSRSHSSSYSSSSRHSSSSRSGGTFINIGNNNRSYGSNNTYGSGGYRNHGGIGGYGSGGSWRPRSITNLIVSVVLVIFLVIFITQVISIGSSDIPSSTVNREKLNAGGFSTNCIVDNEGWFDNLPRTESRLKGFFKKTGVQPYIVINSYNADLVTDADKEVYAKSYYDTEFGVDNGFMYMYFPDEDPNSDGYMYCVVGAGAGTVMDAEAQDIFWSYIDYFWFADKSVDDIFISIFDSTAERIMDKSKTMADVVIMFIVGLILVIVLFAVIKMYKAVTERKHQEALDTERILNADLNTLGSKDDEMSKYD